MPKTAASFKAFDRSAGIARAAHWLGLDWELSFPVQADRLLVSRRSQSKAIGRADAETDSYRPHFMISCAHPDHFIDALRRGEKWLGGVRRNTCRLRHAELDNAEEPDAGDPGGLTHQNRELTAILPKLRVLGIAAKEVLMKTEIRPAEPTDADDLARLINVASEGMSLYLWKQSAAAGQDPWEIGRQRACNPEVGFNWRNTVVSTLDGFVTGSVAFYQLPDEPQPIDPEVPKMFIPLIELENLARNTIYINVLAVYPEYQGRGIGRRLMEHVEAEASGHDLSLIVENTNEAARSLYHSLGFVTEAQRPIIDGGWGPSGDAYCLMMRRS